MVDPGEPPLCGRCGQAEGAPFGIAADGPSFTGVDDRPAQFLHPLERCRQIVDGEVRQRGGIARTRSSLVQTHAEAVAIGLPAGSGLARPRHELRAQEPLPEAACASRIVGRELDQGRGHSASIEETPSARRSHRGCVARVSGGTMRRRPSPLLLLVLALVALGPPLAPARSEARAGAFLHAAKHAVDKTGPWWAKKRRWYRSTLSSHSMASLWGFVPLFQAANGIALARPSARNVNRVNFMAWGANRYFNPTLQPVPGYGPKIGQREPGKTTWFDDNGWFGLAFLDAYQVTHNPTYLYYAQLAQQFISVSGWDTTPGRPGGIWWNTNRSFYAGESLASGTLLSAKLYEITRQQNYLQDALKFIAWGNVWLRDPATGLYARPE